MKKKGLKQILTLVLTFMILPLNLICTYASETDNSADLYGISIGDISIADFDAAITDYEFNVPFELVFDQNDKYTDTYAKVRMPIIKAYPVSGDATVAITKPENVENGTVTINVKSATAEKTYRVRLNPVGLNMVSDGGFNTWAWQDYNRYTTGSISMGDINYINTVHKGTGCFRFKLSAAWNGVTDPGGAYNLKPGVKYLTTYYVRCPETSAGVYASNAGLAADTVKTFYNEDGTKRNGDSLGKIGNSWNRVIQTYESETGSSAARFFPTGTTETIDLDEMYVAPLVVTDIEYTGKKTILIPKSDKESLELSSVVKNQLGLTAGLENEAVSYRLLNDISGVTLSGSTLEVSSDAAAGNLYLEMSTELSFQNEVQNKVTSIQKIAIADKLEKTALVDIQVGGTSVAELNSGETSYDVLVPYIYRENDFVSVDVPEIKAYPKYKDAKITVAEPASADGTVKIRVEHGDEETEYSLRLVPYAINMYPGGNMETSEFYTFNRWTLGVTNTEMSDEIFKAGKKSFKVNTKGYVNGYASELKSNVKYLLSYYVCSPGKEAVSWYGANANIPSDTEKKYYNEDGLLRDGDWLGKLTADWTRVIQTYKSASGQSENAASDNAHKARFAPINFNENRDYYMDDAYYAPLTVTDIENMGESFVFIPDELTNSVNLSARQINQIGGTQGLEDETVTYELLTDTDGVTLTGNTLTVSSSAKCGVLPVRVKSSFSNAEQRAVWDIFEINLIKDEISLSKSGGKAEAIVYTKNNSTDAKRLAISVYEKRGDNLKLTDTKFIDAAKENDEYIDAKIAIDVPEDGGEYVVKAFLWNINLTPVLSASVIK